MLVTSSLKSGWHGPARITLSENQAGGELHLPWSISRSTWKPKQPETKGSFSQTTTCDVYKGSPSPHVHCHHIGFQHISNHFFPVGTVSRPNGANGPRLWSPGLLSGPRAPPGPFTPRPTQGQRVAVALLSQTNRFQPEGGGNASHRLKNDVSQSHGYWLGCS